jgi:hypothetical protein
MEQSRSELASLRRERLDQARREADAILASGRADTEALARDENARLVTELHQCVHQTLGRVVDSVDDNAVRYTVARVLTGTGGESA